MAKKTGNMVSRDLIQATINIRRLRMQINRLENQLKIEKSTNKAHQISINDLEKKLIALGQAPGDKWDFISG
jgi:hypothetical protein